jgi:hypothetical protein
MFCLFCIVRGGGAFLVVCRIDARSGAYLHIGSAAFRGFENDGLRATVVSGWKCHAQNTEKRKERGDELETLAMWWETRKGKKGVGRRMAHKIVLYLLCRKRRRACGGHLAVVSLYLVDALSLLFFSFCCMAVKYVRRVV